MNDKVQFCLKIAINLVFNKDGSKLLLIQEAKEHSRGLWFLPAGKGKEGETILETCVRETEEESGILTRPLFILKTEHIIKKVAFDIGDELHMLDIFRFIFISEPLNDSIKVVETKDSIQAKWFEVDKIQDLPLRSIEVLNYIDLYLNHSKSKMLLKVDDILEAYHD